MSDDFTWIPDPASSRQTNIAGVLAFVGLGVVASSFYPLKLMMTAFAHNTAENGKTTSPTARAKVSAQAPDQPATAEPTQALPQASSRMVLLNPGSSEATTTPVETTANAPFGRLGFGASSNGRHPPALHVKPNERNVLVVVRRRGPPHDTKILRGRIRDGRLIVDVRYRRGISLY